ATAAQAFTIEPSSSSSAPPLSPGAHQGSKKKRGRRNKARNRKKALAAGTAARDPGSVGSSSDEPTARWAPTMPSIGAMLGARWRKPVYAASAAAAPCLVIDDADPDS